MGAAAEEDDIEGFNSMMWLMSNVLCLNEPGPGPNFPFSDGADESNEKLEAAILLERVREGLSAETDDGKQLDRVAEEDMGK
jgi:hypothetical protein